MATSPGCPHPPAVVDDFRKTDELAISFASVLWTNWLFKLTRV